MNIPCRSLAMTVVIGAFLMGACQSTETKIPAVLQSMDAQTMAELKSVLARAMDRASIEIGPGDLTQLSTISVLPPKPTPQEDRSTATPTLFDIRMQGSACFVVRRDTGEAYELAGVSCQALVD